MPTPLLVVELVLRHVLKDGAALDHLGHLVASYLGPDRNLPLRDACKLGSTTLLDWLWECSPTSATDRTPTWSLLNYLRSDPHYYRVVEKAVEQGRMDILRLLVEHDAGRRADEAPSRTENGDGNVVQWGGSSLVTAAQMKRFDIVRFLYENTPRDVYEETLDMAIPFVLDDGEMDLAQELLPPGTSAADYGDISCNPYVVELAFDAGLLDDEFVAGLALTGRLDS